MFILLVEPEVGEMDALCATLSRNDFVFGFVKSKEDAIKTLAVSVAAHAKLYDFVILDCALPGMADEEFQRLSVGEFGPRIIFRFLKATKRPMADTKECKWLGVPFDAEELLSLLLTRS